MLKIVDVFYSIQGEGYFSGYPSIFIRLHGCNLNCSFCDEDLHNGEYKSFTCKEILEQIKPYKAKQVVITGGEPTLVDLSEFIEALHVEDYFVAVESNGYKLENIKTADWITYSPKDWNSLHVEGFSEYKFVVEEKSDIKKIIELKTDKPIYIQPQNNKNSVSVKNTEYCINLVKNNPNLRLSVQLHKYLGVE